MVKKNYNCFMDTLMLVILALNILIMMTIIIQAGQNISFKESIKGRKLGEKVLYQQFNYEIKKSLNSSLLFDVKLDSSCSGNSFPIDLKLDAYYDCTGITKKQLNKKVCQNKITSNLKCCKDECCPAINDESKSSCRDYDSFSDSLDLIESDPRKKYCEYFNTYKTNKNNIF